VKGNETYKVISFVLNVLGSDTLFTLDHGLGKNANANQKDGEDSDADTLDFHGFSLCQTISVAVT